MKITINLLGNLFLIKKLTLIYMKEKIREIL